VITAVLSPGEPLTGFKPDLLPKCPTLSGQAPTIRIPHLTGIPQGSRTVTPRRQPENLSNRRSTPPAAVEVTYPGACSRPTTSSCRSHPSTRAQAQIARRGAERRSPADCSLAGSPRAPRDGEGSLWIRPGYLACSPCARPSATGRLEERGE
jgi:hypothetical protein